MEQSKINKLRNLLHIVGGFTLLYCIGNSTGVFGDFDIAEKIIWSLVAGGVIGAVAGGFYEVLMLVLFKNPADKKDIIKTAIGGVLGCIAASIFKDVNFITNFMFWICLTLLIADITRAFIQKSKS